MDRVALGAILLLIAGVLLHPLITGTGRSTPPTASAQTIGPATQPADLAERSTPQFKQLRGQSGFWRVGETIDGVWWFITPDDRVEFMNMVTTVQPFQEARDPDGIHFVSRDYDPATADVDAWAARTIARVRSLGFKGVGAWSHP